MIRPVTPRLGGVAIVLGAAAVCGGDLAAGDPVSWWDVWVAAVFGCFVLIGELARVSLPGGREMAPLASAGALGYALVRDVSGHPGLPPRGVVVLALALGMTAGAGAHALVGRPAGLIAVLRRIFTAAVVAYLFPPVADALKLSRHTTWLPLLMLGVVFFAHVVDAAVVALAGRIAGVCRFGRAVLDEFRVTGGIVAAASATGVVLALAATVMGLWALPTLCVPLLTTQFSVRRYAAVRATQRQTIRALSRITEIDRAAPVGRAARVADLAVATGRRLRLSEPELLDLEYAALLHDIGLVAEPAGCPPQELALASAAIIRSGGTLLRAADYVERQADPYRRTRSPADPTLQLGSRILRAVLAFEEVTGDQDDDPRRITDALERLRVGMAFDYDPMVVETLAGVLARRAQGRDRQPAGRSWMAAAGQPGPRR